MKRAKEILDIGLQMLSEQGKLKVAWHTYSNPIKV